jgi:hypothetical protein
LVVADLEGLVEKGGGDLGRIEAFKELEGLERGALVAVSGKTAQHRLGFCNGFFFFRALLHFFKFLNFLTFFSVF